MSDHSSESSPQRLACIIVAHNLGDAVIQSAFITALVDSGYAREYVVWTRPQVAFLFRQIPNCDVICSQFPVGTNKQFRGLAILRFIMAVREVRLRRPSVTIDLIGDFRDRLFARLAGSRVHLFIGWDKDHAFSKLIRNPFGNGKPTIVVPESVHNVYAAHELFLRHLRPGSAANPACVVSLPVDRDLKNQLVVGLHPFASQTCKLWPGAKWRELAERLIADGRAKIIAFSAPGEIAELKSIFGNLADGGIEYVSSNLEDFAAQSAKLDVMVGLDSFSVHMAQLQGVRSVLINAGNAPELWAPPASTVLARSGGCVHYPCFNIPKCTNTAEENACVRAITVTEVLNAVYA